MSRRGDDESAKACNKAGKASSSPPKDARIGPVKASGKASSAASEVRIEAVEAILEHAGAGLDENEIDLIRRAFETLWKITKELESKRVSIKRLQRLLFGKKTESFRGLFPKEARKDSGSTKGADAAVTPNGEEADAKDRRPAEDDAELMGADHDGAAAPRRGEEADAKGTREGSPQEEATKAQKDDAAGAGKEKRKGHGRLSSSKYTGAIRTKIPHCTLSHGDLCPLCDDGQSKVYRLRESGRLIRVTGEPPFHARLWEMERLRCKSCGKVFTATVPEGIGKNKYDKSVAATIALLRYGSGFPFNRMEKLQKNRGVPLPAGTQWELVEGAFEQLRPVYKELIHQAAQGDLFHNDDTRMKILKFPPLMKSAAKPEEHTVPESPTETQQTAPKPESESDIPAEDKPSAQATDGGSSTATPVDGKPAKREIPAARTGTYTTGIVSIKGAIRIAMFFTGRQYAGENLADILAKRIAELGPPIHMSDALAQNLPPGFKTIWANCMSHARRKFVEVVEDFPEECLFILKIFKEVYRFDDEAREAAMSPEERLAWHQANSKPLLDTLLKWCEQQFEEKTIEPNSELGKAIRYMTKRWDRFTLFLRAAGAPLDNNICERAIKKAILHRKNSLFYKTEHGAEVGDLFMTLIHTCELNGVDPYDYLLTLLQHEEDLPIHPERWMPWNYKDRLAELAADPAPT